ncbi:MAG: hypothetical protein J4G03_01475 [Gemmatimonadetes bacterium]|nr:hypothetical protein [Gemmatimonadota bacterium]
MRASCETSCGAAPARPDRPPPAENVSGGFWAKAGPARGHETRPVLIVDDVLTTGATINACACALAESGFKCVGAVSFARTLRPLGKRQ